MTEPTDDIAPISRSPQGRELMTTKELMDYLQISRTKLWELVNKQGLPAFKIGGDYRYRRREVDAWLESRRHLPEDEE